MGVAVTANFPPLAGMKLTSRTLMRDVGLLARERIIRRTIAGTDEDEGTFAPYSPGYAARKAQAVGGSGVVNLQLSGAMLNAIVLTVSDTWVLLSFSA